MPRTLPADLTTALNAGGFTAYVAIGRRNYDATPPTALVDYTTLITAILYYKYDGLNLTVKYASANLPVDDGLIVGNKYYIERGVTIAGVNHTIKSASLRFDDYIVERQIVTAFFSLFPGGAKPAAIAGDDTYTSVLTALNPNDYELGTVAFKDTPENADHWGYNFFPTGKEVSLKSYASLLPLIRQKYLLQATDNSDTANEDEIQFFHLQSPIVDRYWRQQAVGMRAFDICWSETLGLFVVPIGISTAFLWTSPNGINWTGRNIAAGYWTGICWSPDLNLFAVVANAFFGGAQIATSPDGITWTTRANNAKSLNSVAWSPELSLFAAVGENAIYTSPDGITWTERAAPTAESIKKIIWVSELSKFVAAGNDIFFSSNGINWTDSGSTTIAKDIAWAPELSLFLIATDGNKLATSPDAITWTERTANLGYNGVTWSPELLLFCAARAGTYLSTSPDGITWTSEGTFTDSTYNRVAWAAGLNSFLTISQSTPGQMYAQLSIEAFNIDHTIEQGDVKLLKNGMILSFLWRDEAGTIHTSGADTSIVQNLGYLESTDSPPASYESAQRGSLTVGIHLKYKTGDIFELKINDTQSATYLGQVTEILDPNAQIGWRCEIELIERFSNTNGGAMPSTIERVAAYTPLVTTNFDGNLDATVNNLQALADRVDDIEIAPAQDPTAANDFLVGEQVATVWTWVKKTLAQTITILRTSLDSIYVTKSVLEGRHYLPFGVYLNVSPMSVTASLPYGASADKDYTLTLRHWSQAFYVQTTNDANNYWTIELRKWSDHSVIASFNTSGATASTPTLSEVTSFSETLDPADIGVYIRCDKAGSGAAPGNLYLFGPTIEVSL
jgi:hypothetical protein